MITPPTPSNENARLASLRGANVLDTPIEDRFERITRTASRLFGTPMVTISLVDSDRQWFKSFQGMTSCETSRDISFCTHGILQDDTMVIEDARQDPRFRDNPLVTGEPNIVFYAGAQIRSPGGENIGMMCVIDTQPRTFSEDDRSALRDLAAMAASEIARGAPPVGAAWHDRKHLIDDVTRVWSRKGITRVAQCVMNTAVDFGRAVISVRADGVEDIERTHGSKVADEVLRQVARRLTTVARETDSIGRLEGPRFVMTLTPCPSAPVASQVSAMARALVGETPIQTVDGSFVVGLRTGVRVIGAGEQMDGADAIADAEMASLAQPIAPSRSVAA